MNIPQDLRYSKEHEWVRVEGNIGIIGITDFAQSELGELVYIEIDSVGEELSKDDVFGTVEAVKTTSELFMPISGKVIEFNDELSEKGGDNPAVINEDPYGQGWIVKIEILNESELDELLSPEQYAELIG